MEFPNWFKLKKKHYIHVTSCKKAVHLHLDGISVSTPFQVDPQGNIMAMTIFD